jgi:hypothetical protein
VIRRENDTDVEIFEAFRHLVPGLADPERAWNRPPSMRRRAVAALLEVPFAKDFRGRQHWHVAPVRHDQRFRGDRRITGATRADFATAAVALAAGEPVTEQVYELGGTAFTMRRPGC